MESKNTRQLLSICTIKNLQIVYKRWNHHLHFSITAHTQYQAHPNLEDKMDPREEGDVNGT
jgi:hypothetical protein